jgi:IclR family pca regulon transcriptional regulator
VPIEHRESVQGLRRGFAVIKAFSADARELTIADVAIRTGLPRAVARRYLFTLEELGCVVQSGSSFRLTPRLLDLGFTYLSTVQVAAYAQPFLEKVVAKLHDSSSIGVLDGKDCVYVARVTAKRIMTINLGVGSRLPAHATSMGKVLLAYLPAERLDEYFARGPLQQLTNYTLSDEGALRDALGEIRARGWALCDQETEIGVRAVAAPIFDRLHHVQAALNVGSHASRVHLRTLKRDYLPVVLDAAQKISRVLGANLDPPRPR